jgi:hypothetical protein
MWRCLLREPSSRGLHPFQSLGPFDTTDQSGPRRALMASKSCLSNASWFSGRLISQRGKKSSPTSSPSWHPRGPNRNSWHASTPALRRFSAISARSSRCIISAPIWLATIADGLVGTEAASCKPSRSSRRAARKCAFLFGEAAAIPLSAEAPRVTCWHDSKRMRHLRADAGCVLTSALR